MTQSSCLCGAIKLSFNTDPVLNFICHCTDDRKITGTMFASNMLIKDDTLAQEVGTTGAKPAMKTFVKTVNSGAAMTNHFCGDCGTTMYRTSSRFPGHAVIKIGTIDDLHLHDVSKPQQEHFVRSRVAWVGAVEGAVQSETDPF